MPGGGASPDDASPDEASAVAPGVPDAAGFAVAPGDAKRPGALLALPFDREMIARLRETFPRARFRGTDGRWFVPGTTAGTRLERWIDGEYARRDAHADTRGQDAFAFDPIRSRYLEAGDDLVVRTPYSRTVIAALRSLPLARWDPSARAWRLPWRGYEALRAVWPTIEAAAERHETGARPVPDAAERTRRSERRRRRLPVPRDETPPLGQPVATAAFGIVVVEAVDEDAALAASDVERLGLPSRTAGYAWAWWQPPTWRDLAGLETADMVDPGHRARGWWAPTAEDGEQARWDLRRIDQGRRARARRRAAIQAG